jgi:serine/threonine protein kinase
VKVYMKACGEVEATAIDLVRGGPVAEAMSGSPSACFAWAGIDAISSAERVVVSFHPGEGFILGQDWARTKRNASEQARVIANLLRACQQIHARGVTHNDLHGKNWLVGPDLSIVLIDFGMASLKSGPHDADTVKYCPMLDIMEVLWHSQFSLGLCREVADAIRVASGCEAMVGPSIPALKGHWGTVPGVLSDWALHGLEPFFPESKRVLTRFNNNDPLYPGVVIGDNPNCAPGSFLGLAVTKADFEATRMDRPNADWVKIDDIYAALASFNE